MAMGTAMAKEEADTLVALGYSAERNFATAMSVLQSLSPMRSQSLKLKMIQRPACDSGIAVVSFFSLNHFSLHLIYDIL